MMNKLCFLIIGFLIFQIGNGQSNYTLNLVPSSECKGSENGTITISISLNNQIPLILPYPLPYEVSYEHEDGSAGTIIMTTNPFIINFLKAGKYIITLYFNDQCYAVGNTEILELPNNIVVNYEVTDIKCKNDGKIFLKGIAGGTSPYLFNWSNGNSNESLLNLNKTGIYNVTITDINGCNLKKDYLIKKEYYNCNLSLKPVVGKYISESQKGTINFVGTFDDPDLKFYWHGKNNGFISNKKELTNLEIGTYCLDIFCCGYKIYETSCYDIYRDCDVIKEPNATQTIELCRTSDHGIQLKIDNYFENKFEIIIRPAGHSYIFNKSNLLLKVYDVGTYYIEVFNKNTYCSETLEINVIDTRNPLDVTVEVTQNPSCGVPYKGNGFLNIKNNTNKEISWILNNDYFQKKLYGGSLNAFESSGIRLIGVGIFNLRYFEFGQECGYSNVFSVDDPNSLKPNLQVTTENLNCNSKYGKLKVTLLNNEAEISINGPGFDKNTKKLLLKGTHIFDAGVGNYSIFNISCNELVSKSIYQDYSDYLKKIDIINNDYFTTPEGEGELNVSVIKSICVDKYSTAYYYLSKTRIADCNEVQNKGIKLSNGIDNFTITGLIEGIYFLYYSCGGCCSEDIINIPQEDSPLELDLNCANNNGNTKVILNGYEDCDIINWTVPSSNNTIIVNTISRSINASQSGQYCVNLNCQNKSKKLCRYVDLTPKVSALESCGWGVKGIYLSPLSDGPLTYLWSDGSTDNGITITTPNLDPIFVTVTDANNCTNKYHFSNFCCPFRGTGTDCKVVNKTNPTNGISNGSILMSDNGCVYKWAGPNGFKKDGIKLDNLSPGDYECSTSDCKKIIVKLRDCSLNDYKLRASGNEYCWNTEEIEITFSVSSFIEMNPPFWMNCSWADHLVTFDKDKGIFKFKFQASRVINKLDPPYVVLFDGAGCQSKHYFDVKPTLTYKIENKPPNCEIQYFCKGKFQFSEPATFSETFDLSSCVLTYFCGGVREDLQGEVRKVTVHDKESNECIEGSVCVFQSPNGDTKLLRSRGDWKKIPCPQINGTTEDENDPFVFQTNFNDIYKAVISFWPSYKNKFCGTYYRKILYNGGFDTHFELESYISKLNYCFDAKTSECKETHECWSYPDNSQVLTHHHDIYKNKIVAASNCGSNTPNCPEPPGLKECPTKFHYLNNLNVFVSLGFNGKAIKLSFYDQNGIVINSTHTQLSVPEGNDWDFNIIDLIPQGTGFSILANATKLAGIGSSIITNNDNPSIIKIDYDVNGAYVNSSILFNDPFTMLYDVLVNPNGSADLLISHDPNDNSTGGQGVGLNIVNLNNNLTGSPLNLPMNSVPDKAIITRSSGGLSVISTNNATTIPSLDVMNFSSLNGTWTKRTITVNGNINSIYSAQAGYTKAVVNYTSMDGLTHSASTLDIQNPGNGFINTLTSTEFIEANSIVPDLQTGDYYVLGTFKGDMDISTNNSISSDLNNAFLIRYSNFNNVLSYFQSTGIGSNNLIDGVVSTNNKIGLLTTFNGSNIQFNGESADGIDFDCNTKVFIFDPRSSGNQIISPALSIRLTSNLIIEGIYPNPTQDNVNFIFVSTQLQSVEYNIHNPAGKTMKVFKDISIQKGRSIRAYDLTELQPGMYFITVKSSEQIIGTYKIIKK